MIFSLNYSAPGNDPKKIKHIRNIFLGYILIAMFGRHTLALHRWGLAFLNYHELNGVYALSFLKYQSMPVVLWVHIFTSIFFQIHCLFQISPKSFEISKSFHKVNGSFALFNFTFMIFTAYLLSKDAPMTPQLFGFTMFINILSIFFMLRGLYFLKIKKYFDHRNNMLRVFILSFGSANQDIFSRIWRMLDLEYSKELFTNHGFYAYLVPLALLEVFYIRNKKTFFLPKGFKK